MRTFKLIAAGAVAAMISAPAVAQPQPDWPSSISIATASQGGTYFIYGNGLAALITQELGINASGEVTGGPVQNVTLVETGDHDLSMATMGPALNAWRGESELAPGLEHRNIRALFPMYQTPFQTIALERSGIKGNADLDGRRVSVGPAGGTPAAYYPRFFEIVGVQPNISYAGGSDSVSQLADGLIEAFSFGAGLPIAAFAQLAAEQDVVMFGFTEEEREKILEALPEVSAFDIPAGTYPGHDYVQPTVSMWNFAIAHKDMPESLAYEITKLVMENNDRMKQIHASAEETVLENWDKNNFLPYHPGAIRYYQEQGIDIPEELTPQD